MSYSVSKQYMIPTSHPNRNGKKLYKIKALVIHYTANYSRGANDIANARYFGRAYERDNGRYEEKGIDRKFRYGSAHYIVDHDSIQMCIPESEIAYHVGSSRYTSFAKSRFTTSRGSCYPNGYTIGIEMCVNQDGSWNKTIQRTAELSADIMIRHNIPMDMLVRHYDITGKLCPKPYVDDSKAWDSFKELVKQKIDQKKGMNTVSISDVYGKVKVTASVLNVRNKPVNGSIIGTVVYNDEVEVTGEINDWYRINYYGKFGYISARYVKGDIKKYMFKDIANHWSKNIAQYFGEKGIINGDSQGNFRPDNPMSRAEVMTVLYRAFKYFGLIK